MKKALLFTLLIFVSTITFAQSTSKENSLKDLKLIQNKHRNFDNKIEREIYDRNFKSLEYSIEKGFTKDEFIVDKNFTNFIQKIFSEITRANSSYQLNNPNFFIVKNNIPNASSFGFDYYMLYNGLFNLAENEYQIAAVLGHEMAHNYLNHSIEEIKQEASFLIDFKKEIKSIKKQEFIRLIKSQDEIIQKKYDLANQSRLKEIAADSLGFVFYSNANFPKSEYLEMLNRLDQYNTKNTIILKDSTYYNLFSSAGISINPKWLKLEKEELFAGLTFTEHVDQDSVKTHPNTNERKQWIAEKFKVENIKTEVVKPSVEFIQLKNKVVEDFYNTMFLNDSFGDALYLLFNEKQNKSERNDLDKNIGIVFTKLHEARLKHEFNKYVTIADANDEDADYHKFLNFLWNLSTNDLKIIGEYYTKKTAE